MGERSSTTTMDAPRRSPMERGQSMGERATTHHDATEKVNQHG